MNYENMPKRWGVPFFIICSPKNRILIINNAYTLTFTFQTNTGNLSFVHSHIDRHVLGLTKITFKVYQSL